MEPKKASPGPWKWHADGRLLDANGRGVPFAENMELFALAPTMADMLRELEWSGDCGECPNCGQEERHGHKPDCRLNALLDRLGRQ